MTTNGPGVERSASSGVKGVTRLNSEIKTNAGRTRLPPQDRIRHRSRKGSVRLRSQSRILKATVHGGLPMSDLIDFTQVYAAELEAARLQALYEQAESDARRLLVAYRAAVHLVRELVRAAGERGVVEVVESVTPDLFTGADA